MTFHDSASFSAGQDAGARLSACLARLAALQLVEEARWWNRWRRRLVARALVACADEMEDQADALRAGAPGGLADAPAVREAPAHGAAPWRHGVPRSPAS